MAGDIIRRSSYLPPCCISPPCTAVHDDYSRIPTIAPRGGGGGRRTRRLIKLLRKMLIDGKTICGPPPKPVSFQYDAVSYSQNFDDGLHRHDPFPPPPASSPKF